MGQQQLLLIVLGIIIVGIAIAVGVNMFQSSAVDTNRQAVISDLANLASKAQRYYRTPTQLGGGSQDFKGFSLGRLDKENGNGFYRVATAAPTAPSDTTSTTSISSSASTIYIIGWGTEEGDNGNYKVEAYTKVTSDSLLTTVVN
ncbi:hypothetical protein B1H10_07140 [candidate division KSB1 bacterium 4484_188]|nr:MAG: hypothetical protein B1H10_07140 [candidate division KSB1 bacterium 4484_188]HFE63049.1 hypothetical protein [Caldithrix sp.]